MRYYTTLIAGILGILMMAVVAHGADTTVEWDASPGAVVGYNIYTTEIIPMMTAEQLAFPVWVLAATVLAPETTTILDLPDEGLVLVRASAYNNIGEAIGTYSGVWINKSWLLALAPTELRTPGE